MPSARSSKQDEDRRYLDEDVVGALSLAIEIAATPEAFMCVALTILHDLAFPTPANNTGSTKCLVEAVQLSSATFAVGA